MATTETRIPFNANETAFKRRLADGHYMNTGHTLTGYYVESEPGIFKMTRTCGC